MATLKPLAKVRQLPARQPKWSLKMLESSELVGAQRARDEFDVRGKGMRAAVLDSGLYAEHTDFDGKKIDGYECRTASNVRRMCLKDDRGHGTYVAGILAANGSEFLGIAPDADLVVVDILDDQGDDASLSHVACGLRWVRRNHERYGINVVVLAYSNGENYVTSDDALAGFGKQDRPWAFAISEEIERLREARVPVVVGAGNGYSDSEGMGFPAILPSAVSVSGVNDFDSKPRTDGSINIVRAPKDGITYFAQRLHEDTAPDEFTTIFAPASTVNATGIKSPRAESKLEEGTSAATPIVAGAILLLQELHYCLVGELPEVEQIVKWLRNSAKIVADDCYGCVVIGEVAMVPTGKNYLRLQIPDALRLMKAELAGRTAQSRCGLSTDSA